MKDTRDPLRKHIEVQVIACVDDDDDNYSDDYQPLITSSKFLVLQGKTTKSPLQEPANEVLGFFLEEGDVALDKFDDRERGSQV